MRWDKLFDDLESQLEHELNSEQQDLAMEEERLRVARLSLRDRIVALSATGPEPRLLRTRLRDGRMLDVVPSTIGRDWIAARFGSDGTQQCIVPLAAVTGLILGEQDIPRSIAPTGGERGPGVSERIGLNFVLRDLCRRRAGIELCTDSGILSGTIDRVGRDHLDLAVHDRDTPRRQSMVNSYRLVSIDSIVLIRL